VGGGVVVMKEPVVVAPKFLSLSSHIFSQGPQNVTVRVTVDRSVRRHRFTVNNPLHVKKKTMSMLFVELRTGSACTYSEPSFGSPNGEKRNSVVHFCGKKVSMQRIFTKKCILITVDEVVSSS
jgi:hypothetical protein